jgi:4'-phosphopantetheinyl transferase EntD
VIELILPPFVAVGEAFHDPVEAVLHPEEGRYVAEAVEERRREFTTARLCAHRTLARLGFPSGQPLLKDRHGAPLWPPGVIGSITHCAGYRAAAASRTPGLALLGIDAEPAAALPPGVLETIALPAELARIRGLLSAHPGTPWDRLLFSMKESVYKAWYPYTGQRLYFEDADVTIDADCGAFTARLLVPARPGSPPGPRRLEGRWLVRAGLLASAIAIPG